MGERHEHEHRPYVSSAGPPLIAGGTHYSLATWQSETAQSHARGKLVMIEGMLITAGITISYWINYGESMNIYSNQLEYSSNHKHRNGVDW